MWRRWLAVLAVAVLVIAALLLIEIFSLASQSEIRREAYAHNQYQPVYASLVQLLIGGWNWLRERTDHDTISTLAIAATACFTGTLWWSTKRLWDSSREHAEHLGGSVQAARVAAEAAQEANRLTRENFVIDVRPWIAVEEIVATEDITYDPSNGVTVGINISVKNVGRSPARNIIRFAKLYPRLFPELRGSGFKKEQAAIFEQARRAWYGEWGDALFPGQTLILEFRAAITRCVVAE